MTVPRAIVRATRSLLLVACCAMALSAMISAASAVAAESPIEDRGAPAPHAHFTLSFQLPGFKQNYSSESAETQEKSEEGSESIDEPETGDYSQLLGLSRSARCFLELDSNAIFSSSPPHVSRGVVFGTGTHLLAASRRELRFAGSGVHGSIHWYLGSLHSGQIIGLTLQPAPAALARARDRYLITEFSLMRRAYVQPRDIYLSPPPSAQVRNRCLSIEQRVIRERLRPILETARATPGRYRPGRRVPGHALPRCVAEHCPALLVTPSIQIYQIYPSWNGRDEGGADTFARWRASGRVTSIGVQGRPAPLLKAAGEYVAYPQASSSKYQTTTSWSVARVDAATGAQIFVPAINTVTDLVLAPDGSLAWIVEGTPTNPRVNSVFRLAQGRSTPEVLASGESIVVGTLTLGAGVVHWREGSVTREAPLA